MKKVSLLILAALLALLFCEFIVRYVIQYPVYGVQAKVHYRNGSEYWSNIWKPHSRFWNVEGGNKVFKRNNLGLPGVDIDSRRQFSIALLGSSYLEAYQISPGLIAASILDSLLLASQKNTKVYNLGCSGHDPYDSWYRLEYYKQKHHFDYVMLVLNSDNKEWFQRHPRPFNFQTDSTFGKVNRDKKANIIIQLRNHSALVSVIIYGLKGSKGNQDTELPVTGKEEANPNQMTQEMIDCINQFQKQYGNKFVLVSIVDDPNFNNELEIICKNARVNYSSKPLTKPAYRLKGTGHLNQTGNYELGKTLYEAYTQFLD